MYWLSLQGVKDELSESEYSDRVALKYYLAFITWQSLIIALFGWPAVDPEADLFFLVLYVLVLAAPIIGVYLVLVRWGKKSEFERPLSAFISVAWVIHVRMVLLLSPLLIYSLYLSRPDSAYPAFAYFLGLVASLFYYVGFFVGLRKVLRGLERVAP